MINSNILNTQLITLLSSLGHTQKICICDAGLPIPKGASCIDLALTQNIPGILCVLELIQTNLIIESGMAAVECQDQNADFYQFVSKADFPVTYISHKEFKEESEQCIAFVRTGECSPYANIILTAGVAF
ncbi:MAG TPA: D-ribose pyranase [Lachnospiraceae bacterium]|jgi:D-ribose pyranase|nr:D-ribose pyranase [Lachnospiraceae bacterium]